jgi:hypothetical protein
VLLKNSATTVAASTFKPSACIQQGEDLNQAVGAESRSNAFLTCKEWVIAAHALCLLCVCSQFSSKLGTYKYSTSMKAFGHVGQQANLFFYLTVSD